MISKLKGLKSRAQLACQDLYSKENADFICISRLFGASQSWCFIAELYILVFGRPRADI
jgi:hypothetical protein